MESYFLGSQTGSWTNEKHLHFLNSMEESFVRAMFQTPRRHLRLDRSSPDTADFKSQIGKLHTTSDISSERGIVMNGRDERRTRIRSSPPSNHTQDQVVPQIDKDETDN